MDKKNRMFRKAAFGGFNKEDVMQYIETMKTEFFDYKAQVEETIRTLNEKLAQAEPAAENALPLPDAPVDTATSINEAAAHLKQVADELCDKMNRLLGRIQPDADAEAGAAEEAPAAQPLPPTAPEDKVEQLLQHLFTGDGKEAPAPAEKAVVSLSDVLPAYCK